MSTQETEQTPQVLDNSIQQAVLETVQQNMSDDEIENYLRTLTMEELYRFDLIMTAVLENSMTSESELDDQYPSDALEELPEPESQEPQEQLETQPVQEIKSDE